MPILTNPLAVRSAKKVFAPFRVSAQLLIDYLFYGKTLDIQATHKLGSSSFLHRTVHCFDLVQVRCYMLGGIFVLIVLDT